MMQASPMSRKDSTLLEIDSVQFAAAIIYADEADGYAELEIMRLGKKSGSVSFKYETRDGSALAGEKFVHSEGYLTLEAGISGFDLRIDLVKQKTWSPSLEFTVELSEPDGCKLGRNLRICRIKLINPYVFPSVKYGDLVKTKEGVNSISGPGLFWEYTKLMVNSGHGVLWRICLTLLLDQLSNLYLLYTLLAVVYLVNHVLADGSSDDESLIFPCDPEMTAYLIGLMYVVPCVFTFAWEAGKFAIDLEGSVKMRLQGFMFRKYLNFDEESRSKIQGTELQEFIHNSTGRLAMGFVGLVGLGQLAGKLALLFYFMVSHNPGAVWALGVMPGIVILWVGFRETFFEVPEEPVKPRAKLNALVAETNQCYRLIASYFQRPRMNDLFHTKALHLRNTIEEFDGFETNTQSVFEFLGPGFIGAFIAFNVTHVLSGAMSLGSFVATINVLKEVNKLTLDAFEKVRQVTKQFTPLRKYTNFLNMNTELRNLKQVQDTRKIQTGQKRRTLRKTLSNVMLPVGTFVVDKIPLVLKDVSFRYGDDFPLLMEGRNLSVEQGKLVTIIGMNSQASAHTLMKLIGGEVFPTEGSMFIPSHLRVLWVTRLPFVLHLPIFDNLVFGGQTTDDSKPERVVKIVDALNIPRVRKMLEDELAGNGREDWLEQITESDIQKIHIARALIMNPEVMVMHRPLVGLEDNERANLTELLREHVTNRGTFVDPDLRNFRRPRTLFVSSSQPLGQSDVDITWHIYDSKTVIVKDHGLISISDNISSRSVGS